MSKGNCQGYCGRAHMDMYPDPKSPPMDTDNCLCLECSTAHYIEEIERLESEAQANGINIEVTVHDYSEEDDE